MEGYAKCRIHMRVFSAMSTMLFCLIVIYCILPLIELISQPDASQKPFPYLMLFPYDANHGLAYAVTYFLTSAAGFCVVTTFFAEDSLFGFFIVHLCVQFDALHKAISTMIVQSFQETLNAASSDVALSELQRRISHKQKIKLIKMVRLHNSLIEYVAVKFMS